MWSYPGALFLSVVGYHHHLGLNTWSSGGAAGEGDARLLEWELLLPGADDVAAAAASLRTAGHEVAETERRIRARDPWGTIVRIVTAGPSEA